MPRVVLPFTEYKVVAPLPPVCIRCGAPATRTIKMQFFGKAVKFLGMTFLTGGEEEYVVVDTPMCDGHPFMGQAKWMIIIGFLLLLPFFGLGALMKLWTHHYLVAFPLIALVVVGSLFIAYVGLTSIGGEGYTRKGVTVTGVSRKFIDALEEEKWTTEDFRAEVRRNRKARTRPWPPLWVSPYFYVPVAITLAFLIFTPIGWLVASRLPEGPWPAGTWNKRPASAEGGPGQAQQQPPTPQSLAPETLPGLIGYWPLDDERGAAAAERSGNNMMAFVRGGQWVPGVKGSALRLNGTSDHVELGPDARLNFGAGVPFTLTAWIATEADEGNICSFRGSRPPSPVIALLVSGGRIHGWVRDDGSRAGAARPAGGLVKDGKWHHVALVRHPDGTVELFLDAVSQDRQKGEHSGGAITTDLRALGTDRFVVVARKQGPTGFAGSIDEFCVYNRDLTAEEIALLAGSKK
jgi:hypothetical protein